ncbi:hypothetical protein PGH12_15740 [Chryseobacterium wangxinyae]|uniref:hypothetical protein n=1 Tax=Chryseobacterium sp. CY350 TaxID=2997336 RepID=UPI00226FD688|nr:hypothetical protein [Chryseobacterium sp. CY350]MCY0977817.1 hypothetical protein [Chryseobacterium sp. CY350]WBZ94905.1 hypothetical protein PGH12_15740 [Chryseobacterium sp. CY350]
MKKFFLFSCLMILVLGCSQNGKSQDLIIKQIPIKNHVVYGINTSIQCRFDLLINDISAVNNSLGYATYDINPYVLKNGKYKIKIKLHTKGIPQDILEKTRIHLVKYLKNDEGEFVENSKETIEELVFKLNFNKDSIIQEQEWEVYIKELPYELEGWNKGQDLRKLNQKDLEQKVMNYYKKVWSILNNGDGNMWSNLTQKRSYETAIFDYNSKEELERFMKENEDVVSKKAKNMLIPLEDFEMKIYADGKLVTLERKAHTRDFNNSFPLDIKGWSPLIRKYSTGGGSDYPILLYLPEDSNEFVIIRK